MRWRWPPAVALPAYLADFADALAHLGATVGETSRTDLALLRALRAWEPEDAA